MFSLEDVGISSMMWNNVVEYALLPHRWTLQRFYGKDEFQGKILILNIILSDMKHFKLQFFPSFRWKFII